MGSATAITPSVILKVEKQKMVRLLHGQHAMSDRFIAHMLARNIRIEEDLIDQLFNSSEKRLARALLLLARYGKQDKPVRVVPKMSQATLAETIGATRVRVNFLPNKFKELGFIGVRPRASARSQQLSPERLSCTTDARPDSPRRPRRSPKAAARSCLSPQTSWRRRPPRRNPGATWLVRAFLRRVPVEQREQFVGRLRRSDAVRHDVAVLELLAVHDGVVIQILSQCGPFEGEAGEQSLGSRPREDVRAHLRIRL